MLKSGHLFAYDVARGTVCEECVRREMSLWDRRGLREEGREGEMAVDLKLFSCNVLSSCFFRLYRWLLIHTTHMEVSFTLRVAF